jgi:hypothetical protein
LAPEKAALSANESAALDAFADTILPNASTAGISAFVNAMLTGPDPMLSYKLLGLPGPPSAFYGAALAALDRVSVRRSNQVFAALPAASRPDLLSALLKGGVAEWDGPPFSLFYFLVRNDALDVVYGMPAAYDGLSVPYMPHIDPPRPW